MSRTRFATITRSSSDHAGMGAVVVGLVLVVVALFVRAVRLRKRPEATSGPWAAALLAAVLVGWFSYEQLVVGSGHLARTLDRVYVVMTPREEPGNVTGPLGLLAGAELELDTDLHMTLGGDRTRTSREEVTAFEVTQRRLGVTLSAACVLERVVQVDGRDSRSYVVDPGRCT